MTWGSNKTDFDLDVVPVRTWFETFVAWFLADSKRDDSSSS